MKLISAIAASLLLVIASSQPTLALDIGTEKFFNENYVQYYDPTSVMCEGSSGGSLSADVSANIPPPWQQVFSDAAVKFNVNPNFLAALYLTENGNTWKDVGSTAWPSSPAGAKGPMQFMPATWDSYATDGDGDGVPNINSVPDAVFAAAKLVSALGGKTDTPLGSISKPWRPGTLLYIAASYNWGEGNVGDVNQNAGLDAGPEETANYLKNINSLMESNFTESGHPNYRDPEAPSGGGAGGPLTTSSSTECGDAGGIASANGFTFPLLTTKRALRKGTDGSIWCSTSQSSCHHDYNAADIFVETGTPIIAAKGGVVIDKTTDSCNYYGCNISIMGDDNVLYYYTHMSQQAVVNPGHKVTAGQRIGRVGTNATAMNTPRHLHFDMLPGDKHSYRPGCSGAACSGYPFINVQPLLIEAYKSLPE